MSTTTRCVMLLVDADNVSADVIEQAIAVVIEAHGAVHIRRAYCTAEAALKHQALFRRLSIRPMVNLATGKNSTDIALAIDALDLAVSERPEIAVIVSSDSDFAPLVIRLREKGCRVWGIGQQGKTGDDIESVYDAFTVLVHRPGGKAPAPRAAKSPRARKSAEPRRAAEPRKPAEAPKAPPPPPALPEEVARILQAVPALREGGKLELRMAAEPLRAAGLLSKSAASPKLFKKHPDHFALTPEKQPNKVQYLGSASAR